MVSRPAMAIFGLLGGAAGAGAMSAVRAAARRAGWIDKTVPEAVEEWTAYRAGVSPPGGRPAHHLADQLLHAGYSMAWGAAWGAGAGRQAGSILPGAAFGLGLWALGALAAFPLLRAARPAWRAGLAENAVNVGAHLLYGVVTALIAGDLAQPHDHRRTSDREREATRVA